MSRQTYWVVLVSRFPVGEPRAIGFSPLRIRADALPNQAGQFCLRTIWLSLDPLCAGRMRDGPSYAAPVARCAVMEAALCVR